MVGWLRWTWDASVDVGDVGRGAWGVGRGWCVSLCFVALVGFEGDFVWSSVVGWTD